MNILIIQLGSVCECLVSTSIVKGLWQKYKNPEISVIVADQDASDVFRYNPHIKNIILWKDKHLLYNFQLIINLTPGANEFYIESPAKIGFGYSDNSKKCYEILYGNHKTKQNIFQVYYSLSGMKWHGEGYGIFYYPKNRSNNNRTGIKISNIKLREHIINRLNLAKSKIWNVPFNKKICKKIDAINTCQNLVTDDFLSMHIGIALRKYVYFLQTIPYGVKMEFFGKGETIEVPLKTLRWV